MYRNGFIWKKEIIINIKVIIDFIFVDLDL